MPESSGFPLVRDRCSGGAGSLFGSTLVSLAALLRRGSSVSLASRARVSELTEQTFGGLEKLPCQIDAGGCSPRDEGNTIACNT